MKRSLSSVALVVFSLFVAFAGTWLYLLSKAKEKPLKTPFEHAFLTSTHVEGRRLLLLRVTSPQQLQMLPGSTKFTIGAWLDVRLAGENQLVISPDELLLSGSAKGKPIEIASKSECREAGLFELSDFYQGLNQRPAILNLISRRPGLSQKILEVWGDPKTKKPLSTASTVMQSESEGTMKELREAEPRGLYGSGQATLIQLEVLSNLGLTALTDLKSDLLISAIEERRDGQMVPRVRPATLEEAHRRGLKRYAGPTRTKEATDQLIQLGYDGVLIETRETLDSILQ